MLLGPTASAVSGSGAVGAVCPGVTETVFESGESVPCVSTAATAIVCVWNGDSVTSTAVVRTCRSTRPSTNSR